MSKVNYLKFRQSLVNLGETYFTLKDLKKFYPHQVNSLKSLLSRWSHQELIFHLGRGYYTFDPVGINYLQLACNIVRPSYISFEYALYYHHLIDQVPQIVTLASQDRHKLIKMGFYTFEYAKLKSDLIFGYKLEKDIYVAEPEKAFIDLVYLIARGKRIADLDSLEKDQLDKRKIKEYLKKFPHYMNDKVQRMLEG